MLAPDFFVSEKAPRRQLAPRPRHLPHRRRVGQDVDRLEQALPLVRGDEDAGGAALARDLDRLAAFLDAPEELEQLVLGLRHGGGRHSGHYNGYRARRNISRDRTGM